MERHVEFTDALVYVSAVAFALVHRRPPRDAEEQMRAIKTDHQVGYYAFRMLTSMDISLLVLAGEAIIKLSNKDQPFNASTREDIEAIRADLDSPGSSAEIVDSAPVSPGLN